MARPGLIEDHLAQLASHLPAPVVAELVDGLHETYLFHRRTGLASEEAARLAVTEFGDPALVIAAFVTANPARRSARALLLTGPLVGAAWANTLLARHAWDWPVPLWARLAFGTAILTGVALLAVAGFGQDYRRATRSAAAACLVVLAVDTTMLGYIGAAGLLTTWPAILSTRCDGVAAGRRCARSRRATRVTPAFGVAVGDSVAGVAARSTSPESSRNIDDHRIVKVF
jgi:hypothetical protein